MKEKTYYCPYCGEEWKDNSSPSHCPNCEMSGIEETTDSANTFVWKLAYAY